MMERFEDAFQYIELAEQQSRILTYIRARIIFMRILQCYLNKQPTGSLLTDLRKILNEPGSFEYWSMEPVIDYLKTKKHITPQQADILITLIKVLSNIENISLLDGVF
jgi:hypothetical protein